MPKLLVFTYIPSPYQVELFNAISLSGKFGLQVVYLQAHCNVAIANRWQQPNFDHEHLILENSSDNEPQLKQLKKYIDSSDLVVFNYYRHPCINKLIIHCRKQPKPWCFWGERPGVKHSGWLGWLYRRWKLAQIHQSTAAVWGVGIWGIEQYRREFGHDRPYFNIPYFSNLNRFQSLSSPVNNAYNSHRQSRGQSRIFLYSGALIKRKGVDLLAAAFCQLAAEFKQVYLHLVGEGNLQRELEQQVAIYRARVKFFGFQPWEQLPHYYAQADILCVPSRYDGWGLVVPEGLAAGLPVISTNRTGAAIDLIQDDGNGWIIDADQPESLYQAMYQAATFSEQELTKYSQAARDRAQEHSLKHGVQRFEQAAAKTIQNFYDH